MVYLDNDFYSSMVANRKNGNIKTTRQEILTQIGDLISKQKSEVIEALNASGVAVQPKATDRIVVNALVKNLPANRKLQMGIAYLIAKKNDLLIEKKAGFGEKTAEGAAGGAGAGPIGAIVGAVAGAVGDVFSYKAAKTNAAAQEDANRAALIAAISGKKAGGNTGLYIGLGLAALAIIAAVVIVKRKGK